MLRIIEQLFGHKLETSRPAASFCGMESLESREFLSATLAPAVHKTTTPPPAITVATKKTTAPSKTTVTAAKSTKTVKAPAPAPRPQPTFTTNIKYPNLLGTWNGTLISTTNGKKYTLSVTFTKQKNGSATGTFNLNGLGGAKSVVTTVQETPGGVIEACLPTPQGQFSFTAGMGNNGQLITMKWCAHIGITWIVGVSNIALQP